MDTTSYNTGVFTSGASETYATTYGGDFISFSDGGYVWASHLGIRVRAPDATMTGTIVVGSLQYKQLINSVNVKQLIQLGVQLPVQNEASINVAINNDAMIYDDSVLSTKYATESIGYIIICSPARSLQNDTNLSF